MPLFYAEKILFQISGAESSTFFLAKKETFRRSGKRVYF